MIKEENKRRFQLVKVCYSNDLEHQMFIVNNFSTSLVVLIPTFDLLSIQEADGASLVISLAEEKDEGKYVCQISTYKPTEIKHTVKIRGKLRLIYSLIETNP